MPNVKTQEQNWIELPIKKYQDITIIPKVKKDSSCSKGVACVRDEDSNKQTNMIEEQYAATFFPDYAYSLT